MVLAALVSTEVAARAAPASRRSCTLPTWVAPVDGVVIDDFRPPERIGAPGNRGWEFSMVRGSPVLAAADGVVSFAGTIGTNRFVSVLHCDLTRTTYSFLGSIAVQRGDPVVAGQLMALGGPGFHFGVVRHGSYVDPAEILGPDGRSRRPRLVPTA
jgi:murein DD-endopeptidase MepM/ murein hydrolase activator NlpD